MMRKLIDRIAAKAGYLPARRCVPAMRELIVFRDYEDACNAGFRHRSDPDLPHIAVWYPGLGIRGLRMRSIQRVTVPRDMLHRSVGTEGRLEPLLRAMQRQYGDSAVWIAL